MLSASGKSFGLEYGDTTSGLPSALKLVRAGVAGVGPRPRVNLSIVVRKYWIRDEPTPSRGLRRAVIVSARMVLRSLADQAGLVVPSSTPPTRHRIGESLGVRARSGLGGLHYEYSLVPALA
jgi:hypothetical protein